MELNATDQQDNTPEHPLETRPWRAALTLYTRGLVTMAEVAKLLGISRQLAEWHIRSLNFNWRAARKAHIQSLWKAALAKAEKDE